MAEVTSECKLYTLSLLADDLTQLAIIRGWLRDSPMIESAMAPFGVTFYFKSYAHLKEIRNAMNFMFPNGQFMICEISIPTIDGNMPKDVWAWFGLNNDGNPNEIKIQKQSKKLSIADMYKME